METKAKENIENESSKSSDSSPHGVVHGRAVVFVMVKTDQGEKLSKRILGKECFCKVCNYALQHGEKGVIIMSKCVCTFALMHQECIIRQSKNVNTENTTNCCDVCHQNIQIADVNLLWNLRGGGLIPPRERYGMIERQEDEFLIVKVKSTQGQVDEQDEKIPEQEAICRSCFDTFKEDNVVMTKCKCGFALIHQKCAVELSDLKGNNKCDVCGQDGQDIPVILTKP